MSTSVPGVTPSIVVDITTTGTWPSEPNTTYIEAASTYPYTVTSIENGFAVDTYTTTITQQEWTEGIEVGNTAGMTTYVITTTEQNPTWLSDVRGASLAPTPNCTLPSSYLPCQNEWDQWAMTAAIPMPSPPAEPG